MKYTDKDRDHASERLVKIADAMETAEKGTAFMRELKRDYRHFSKIVLSGVQTKDESKQLSPAEVRESRKKALQKIVSILADKEKLLELGGESAGYYSKEKFIVSWNGQYNNMIAEFSIDLTDHLYKSMTGYKCIYAVRSLFFEKQLKAFVSVERALLEVGIKLCPNRVETKIFFDTYVTPYNERLKEQIKGQNNPLNKQQ